MAKSKSRSTINIRLGTRVALAKARAGVELAAQEGEKIVIERLRIPPERTGVHYSGQKNVSAAEGEAPAPQTGQLIQGTAHEPAQLKGKTVSAKIASRTGYAAAQELGTDRMPEHPFLSPLRDNPEEAKRLKAAFIIGAKRVKG